MELHKTTSRTLTNSKARIGKQANLHETFEPQYQVEDQVLLSTKNVIIERRSMKINPLWIGPFTIASANNNRNNYGLEIFTQ